MGGCVPCKSKVFLFLADDFVAGSNRRPVGAETANS